MKTWCVKLKKLRDSIPTLKQMFNKFLMIQDWNWVKHASKMHMKEKCVHILSTVLTPTRKTDRPQRTIYQTWTSKIKMMMWRK
jgi:hypothetical protein